ncbi:MAG TPA: TolC family protein, partial [Nevskiaceae bacterium]|nr:TolC family protein [Nevskiaceae bacterium]
VQNAEANAQASRAQVEFAGAGNRPRVSLDGSADTSDNGEFGYDRLTTWQVLLKLQIPIYQGGLTHAKVAEATARAEQASAVAEDTRRAFAETATREWEMLQAADEVMKSYQAQVDAAQSALDGVRKELEVGSRTTLDLLNAEREVLAAQVNLLSSRRDRAVTAFSLLAACGELEPDAIP